MGRHIDGLKQHYIGWQAGAIARAEDRRIDENPLVADTSMWTSWRWGWMAIDEAINKRLDMAKYL
jgi:hypothetical protein